MLKKERDELMKARKPWPADCIWPEPLKEGYGDLWDPEDAWMLSLDDEGQELLDIKEYMDGLVECGRLNEDYSLNELYDEDELEEESDEYDYEDDWEPELGQEYWDDRFDIEFWEEDLINHINMLKLPLPSPVDDIQRIIGYEFVNENLLRQAFTRRAFAAAYGTGDSELLEFTGDSILNMIVTREMERQLTALDLHTTFGPFSSLYSEGDMTHIRAHYVSSEYLAERAGTLGLDSFILYGPGEKATASACEDMMEALVGAVAEDSDWDWHILENVVDQLLCIQLSDPGSLIKQGYYDIFNSWHQKHFGIMPEYELSAGMPGQHSGYVYNCTLRFYVPENDSNISVYQRVDVKAENRSRAREIAAEKAYSFVVNNGLWMNLKDAGIEPDPDNAINQLQELYQKKYVEQPVYEFENQDTSWYCSCVCGSFEGWGRASSKTKAKKKASYMVLVRMFMSAGCCRDECKDQVEYLE